MIEETTENRELLDTITKTAFGKDLSYCDLEMLNTLTRIAFSKDLSYRDWIDLCIACYDHDNGDVWVYEGGEIHFNPMDSEINNMINMAMCQNKMFFKDHLHVVMDGNPEIKIWNNPTYLTKKESNDNEQ